MRAEIGATSDWGLGINGGAPYRVEFKIPMLPPSVNHYVTHGGGFHRKSPAAKAFDRDFPIFSAGYFVVGERFELTFTFTPGPKDKGDIDNRNKCLLDCIAKAGMLRDRKGKELSDAWVKRLVVEIHDSEEQRAQGPETRVLIEAMA